MPCSGLDRRDRDIADEDLNVLVAESERNRNDYRVWLSLDNVERFEVDHSAGLPLEVVAAGLRPLARFEKAMEPQDQRLVRFRRLDESDRDGRQSEDELPHDSRVFDINGICVHKHLLSG